MSNGFSAIFRIYEEIGLSEDVYKRQLHSGCRFLQSFLTPIFSIRVQLGYADCTVKTALHDYRESSVQNRKNQFHNGRQSALAGYLL